MSANYYLYHFYYKIIIIKQKYLDIIECVNFVQLVHTQMDTSARFSLQVEFQFIYFKKSFNYFHIERCSYIHL